MATLPPALAISSTNSSAPLQPRECLSLNTAFQHTQLQPGIILSPYKYTSKSPTAASPTSSANLLPQPLPHNIKWAWSHPLLTSWHSTPPPTPPHSFKGVPHPPMPPAHGPSNIGTTNSFITPLLVLNQTPHMPIMSLRPAPPSTGTAMPTTSTGYVLMESAAKPLPALQQI